MNRRQLTLSLSFIPALLASALVSVPTLVVAQNKPISIVVPYPAGGPLDISARILAEGARNKLDTTVVVENKPGAGGTIGANQVAKSAAGSQQLLMGAIATHAAITVLRTLDDAHAGVQRAHGAQFLRMLFA